MSKLLKTLGAFVLLYVVVMGGSGLLIRVLLSGSLGEQLRAKAQGVLPVEVTIGGGEFDLVDWFLFRPSIAFDNLRVANPPGFSDEPLFVADRIAARTDLSSMFSKQLLIHSLEVAEPRVRVERDGQGGTNLDALRKQIAANGENGAPDDAQAGGLEVSIADLLIDDGSAVYIAPGKDDLVARNINVRLQDVAAAESFPVTFSVELFNEAAVSLAFDGVTGPFSANGSPAKGALTIDARPGKLPADFRRRYLGAFLADPGPASRLQIDADLEGDFFGTLTGTGTARLEDLRLGRPDEQQFPLNGEAQLLITLIDLVTAPSYYVIMPDAGMNFGLGRWQGGLEVQYSDGRLEGRSTGAISKVQVQDLLAAFTETENTLFGDLELRRYDVRFSGSTSEQIMNSLAGNGRIEIANGKMALFDLLGTIEKQVNRVLTGEKVESGFTSFVEFSSDFDIRDQRVQSSDLLLENEATRVTGAGSFGFDESLDFDLSSLISGTLAKTLGGRPDADGVAQVAAPLEVGGTMAAPRVFLDVKKIAKDAAVRNVRGVLDKLLGGGEEDQAGEEVEQGGEAESKPRLPFDIGDLFKRKQQE